MARLARLSLGGELHLILQRGNNAQPVFQDDADRASYLEKLAVSAPACGLVVHAYALLPNQVHLLATPAAADSLSQCMQTLGRSYVASFNRRHGRTGTLWEGRFRATVVEAERHFLEALVYVDTAAERAGLGSGWPWASTAHHLGQRHDPVVTEHRAFWALGNTPFDREAAYRALLARGLSAAQVEQLSQAQHKGWVLGSAPFLAAMAQRTERPLAPRPRGRPRKAAPAHPPATADDASEP
ncbi:transposase [Aquincola tertiaricarbonis]|uniref:Transposase n=1 Tax=Aquincola tertiaricarbonis TaxID=391953 RepID=A0ABY4SBD3_AQUTE|nr:transposase [Aquincola tertiaricarbonis]URI10658.1 transposase [Aquincola tertiaricarbonis]